MGYTLTDTYYFLSGAAMFASWVCGVFFIKYWKRTRDRLFLIFAAAFWFMTLERLVLLFSQNPTNEYRAGVYVLRLIAFLIILYGIFDKNRRESQNSP